MNVEKHSALQLLFSHGFGIVWFNPLQEMLFGDLLTNDQWRLLIF
jgi:hypothetical protein